MCEITDLKAELDKVRAEYQSLIDSRVALLAEGNMTALTHQNGGLTAYFPAEIELYEKVETLKRRLSDYEPENYFPAMRRGRRKGDLKTNGECFVCSSCRGLFEYRTDNKENSKRGFDKFDNCGQHKERKRVGELTYNMEVVQWL